MADRIRCFSAGWNLVRSISRKHRYVVVYVDYFDRCACGFDPLRLGREKPLTLCCVNVPVYIDIDFSVSLSLYLCLSVSLSLSLSLSL